jgi:hypothetical protein
MRSSLFMLCFVVTSILDNQKNSQHIVCMNYVIYYGYSAYWGLLVIRDFVVRLFAYPQFYFSTMSINILSAAKF